MKAQHFVIVLLLANLSIIGHAQLPAELRSQFRESTPEHNSLLVQVQMSTDSVLLKSSAIHKNILDSLVNDSLTNTMENVGLALQLEMSVLDASNPVKHAKALFSAQTIALSTSNANPLMLAVHSYLNEQFTLLRDFEKASKSTSELLRITNEMNRIDRGMAESEMAELLNKTNALQKKTDHLQAESDQNTLLKPVVLGLLVLFVLLTLIFVILFLNRKKKHLALKQILEERSAEMNETQKISVQYKNEGTQFKQTVEAAINKLNQIESAKVIAHRDLNLWREESSQELSQLKDLVDEMKDAPTVTTYMSVQNHLMRLQNRNKEALAKMADLLKK